MTGIEPARLLTIEPKSIASASSATSAKNRAYDLELIPRTFPSKYKLDPGTLSAHGRFHLMLLRSRPDMIRGFPLRKTQTSSPRYDGLLQNNLPLTRHHPCYSGFHRYKAPLLPRLRGMKIILILSIKVKCYILFFEKVLE